jgi:hypothetical protein
VTAPCLDHVRAWRLVLPADVPPVSQASRSLPAERAVAAAVADQATLAAIPRIDGGTVVCVLRMPGTDRFDVTEWAPTLLAAREGLVTAGVFSACHLIRRPELRGASGHRQPHPQLVTRIYAPGQAPPPPMGKHLAGRLEDYDDIGGDDLHYLTVADQLKVAPRTVLRWRARRSPLP